MSLNLVKGGKATKTIHRNNNKFKRLKVSNCEDYNSNACHNQKETMGRVEH